MTTDLLNIKDIPYGELDSKGAAALNRIFNTLLVDDDGELVTQFYSPSELANWCNLSEEEGLSFYKYLLDNEILYQDTETPRLLFNSSFLPDKYKRKYFN